MPDESKLTPNGPFSWVIGFDLIFGLRLYFPRRGYLADGVSWARAALERAPAGSAARARLLLCLGGLENARGNYAIALDYVRPAAAGLKDLRLERHLALALNEEVSILLFLRRYAESEPLIERALRLSRRSGDVRNEGVLLSNRAYLLSALGRPGAFETYALALRCVEEAGAETQIAAITNCIAAHDFMAGRYDAARRSLERALTIRRHNGDLRAVAGIVSDLADVALMQGATERARALYAEALDLAARFERWPTLRFAFTGLAALAAQACKGRDAARLLGAARLDEPGRNAAEQLSGEDAFDREMSSGRELSRRAAVALGRTVLERLSRLSATASGTT